MALIALDHVSKIYPKGTRPALDDITVHIDRGDFVFLVGASGSGKTTLLSLLLHEEEATDGEIRVAGNDLRRLSDRQVPQYRRSIGFIFQDFKLLNNKTVWQNVAFALEVIGTSRSTIRSLVPKVLETVGLTGKERNYPHELSGGEAQRVAIARAYVNHPQILLADEPTGNLDPTTSLGIMEVLDAINRTGTTVVMATHNEEIVNSMRKRVVELHNGTMVRDQTRGSYDSALFFPDVEVESKATAQQVPAGAHNAEEPDAEVAGTVAANGTLGHSAAEGSGAGLIADASKADAAPGAGTDPVHAMNAVVEAMRADTGQNAGIARLAKSVHSGRTGRYGETFKSVETSMTWGRGLVVDGGSDHNADDNNGGIVDASGASDREDDDGESVAADVRERLADQSASTPPAPPAPPANDKGAPAGIAPDDLRQEQEPEPAGLVDDRTESDGHTVDHVPDAGLNDNADGNEGEQR
ncbi:MAG: cell division ATP-binding protein FtsE [Bifidobacterium sp.]|jgi:cell division transport system ATP-binding protein|nr:cell division ATP-binding protein FtsE [Bifidobacterium sp.]